MGSNEGAEILERNSDPELSAKLVEAALFCGLSVFFLDPYAFALLSLSLPLLLIFPRWRWAVLAISTVAQGVNPHFWRQLGHLGTSSALELFAFRLAFFLTGTGLLLSAVALCSRFRFSLLWLLLFVLGLLSTVHPGSQEGWQVIPLAIGLVCTQKFFAGAWMLGLPAKRVFSLSGFVSLGGFWSAAGTGICPVPAGRTQLLAADVSGSEATWKSCRRKGLLLLIVVLALMAAQNLFGRWIFGQEFQGGLSNRFWLPKNDLGKFGWSTPFGFPSFPLNDFLIKPVLIIAFVLVDIGIRFGYCVAAARMAGFDLPPMIGRVWEARSFTDFLGRCYYYYNRILLQFFFWPDLFRPLPRRFQAPATTFMMVFVGGVIFHFIRDFGDIQRIGLVGAAEIYLDAVPYYLALGCAAAWGVGTRKVTLSWWPEWRWFRVTIYFVLFALIYTLLINSRHLRTSEGDTWKMLERLLGKN